MLPQCRRHCSGSFCTLGSAPLPPSLSLGPALLPLETVHEVRIQAFQKHTAGEELKLNSLERKKEKTAEYDR